MLITDADRDAANALRAVLADISGFWHNPGDDSPLCQALARHRLDAEQRLPEKLAVAAVRAAPPPVREATRAQRLPHRPRRLAAATAEHPLA